VEFQAQASTMQVAAKNNITVQSANAHVDWASPKKISICTAGGANITMEGGNITVQCPGTITVKAGKKEFTGPQYTSVAIQAMPKAAIALDQAFVLFLDNGEPVSSRRFELLFEDGAVIKGTTDSSGNTGLKQAAFPGRYRVRVLNPGEA
jgi:uncharacterized protein (DUF2345 family)